MAVKLTDIAKKAQVSESTVSRALNNDNRVNKNTKNKIVEIAEELNYIPNYRAKALANQVTKIIGVVIPRIDNLFFAEFVQAIKSKLINHGYNMILCTTNSDTEQLEKYIKMFKGGYVDGVIFGFINFPGKVREIAEFDIPIVCAGNYGSIIDNENIYYINLNLKEGCYQATKYLIELGHKKIAFVGDMEDRFRGYKLAMEANTLEVITDYVNKDIDVNNASVIKEFGENIARKKVRPTGLVCYNDKIAIGLMQTFISKGIKIPEEISVCGFDNIEISCYYNPPLTTVNLPKKRIGDKSADILIKNLSKNKQGKSIKKKITYECDLVVRKSTTSINQATK